MLRLGFFLLLVGCAPTLPRYTIHPPPRWDEVRPTRSVLFVSSALPLGALMDAAARVVPPVVHSSGDTSLGALPLHAELDLVSQPLALRVLDDGLSLEISAVGSVTVSAGPLRCVAHEVVLEASAQGRPALEGSSLALLALPKIAAHTTGSLSCAGVRVPLDPILGPTLRLLTHELEQLVALARIPVAPLLRKGLDELGKPRAIDVEGQRACIDLAPSALVVAPLGGHDREVVVRLGAEVAPRISLGECPHASRPPLDRILARQEALGELVSLDVVLAIAHEQLEPLLARELVGRTFGGHGRHVTIDSVELGDVDGRVLVRCHVHGALNGNVYLWGTPALEVEGDRLVLTVPDLQVALETRHLVERVELALWQALDGGLPAAARAKLRLDVTDRVAALRARIPHELERAFLDDHLTLRVEPMSVVPVDVLAQPGVLGAVMRLDARITATIR